MLKELLKYFNDNEITRRDVADKTGMSLGSIRNIFCGADPLSPSAMYKIMAAYPATIAILLPAPIGVEQEAAR